MVNKDVEAVFNAMPEPEKTQVIRLTGILRGVVTNFPQDVQALALARALFLCDVDRACLLMKQKTHLEE